ncbi:ABC transporter substrate-binding protein [Schaalia vaccimaxillae]|uniref:ABC transporter substrate-binding protein n=1 Tax=Schaalia vaccimaxillae TaxID=183916 RepID=UPI0003B76479|nr:ABC transporter substrate-binding protein [Schaalia vaccimaxillae]
MTPSRNSKSAAASPTQSGRSSGGRTLQNSSRGHHILAPGIGLGATLAGAALLISACGGSSSLEGDSGASTGSAANQSGAASSTTLVVGSQDYYSNEIIAEVYAQALEAEGYTVDRQMRIGQREVYMPELQEGSIDVFPEYTGNLLQYLDADATVAAADEVYAALAKAMPENLRVLDQSDASDQDTYVVTKEFADANNVSSLADLAGIEGLVVGGNSELETRPYGPTGLKDIYGVNVGFTPIEDSGGSLTVKALRDDDVQLVDIYSADPVLAGGDLVTLEDPKGMFLASHVVPLASDKVDEAATAVINKVSAAMSAQDLVELNRQSVEDQASAGDIAAKWLKAEGLVD